MTAPRFFSATSGVELDLSIANLERLEREAKAELEASLVAVRHALRTREGLALAMRRRLAASNRLRDVRDALATADLDREA